MESRFQIRVDFDRNTPFLFIIQRNSDDTRDEIVKAFLEKLGGDSLWCRIECTGCGNEGNFWHITPIVPNPETLEHEADQMLKAAAAIRKYQQEKENRSKGL